MVEFVHMFTIFLIRVTCIVKSLEFFTVKIKLAEMAVLASKDNNSKKKLHPVGLNLLKQLN